jgi:hypothetical protein
MMRLGGLKPAASARQHLLLAAAMWGMVGIGLLGAGTWWAIGGEGVAAAGILVAALGAGALKSWLVLDRTADRIARRIVERGDSRCIGGFLSVPSWLLVIGMVLAGRFLRALGFPPGVAGFIYVAVGAGLLLSSRRLWRVRAGR